MVARPSKMKGQFETVKERKKI